MNVEQYLLYIRLPKKHFCFVFMYVSIHRGKKIKFTANLALVIQQYNARAQEGSLLLVKRGDSCMKQVNGLRSSTFVM